jgi:RNA polymerase sigma-70 factor, ECF subfamily
MRDPDEALLARVAEGDAAAVRALIDAKLPRLLALATRMLGDRQDAEDVAQESFVRLWRQAPRWRSGEARLDTWLHRVALNLCTDRLRRRREVPTSAPPETPDPAPLADAGIEAVERASGIEAALARLPERQRTAIVLQYYQGLGNIESAALMGIGVEALESLLARGRRSLRAMLREADDA